MKEVRARDWYFDIESKREAMKQVLDSMHITYFNLEELLSIDKGIDFPEKMFFDAEPEVLGVGLERDLTRAREIARNYEEKTKRELTLVLRYKQ